MLAEVRREDDNLILATVRFLDAINVVPAFLVAHKQHVAGPWSAGQVTDGAVCVIHHKVRSVHPLNLGGRNVGTGRNLLSDGFCLLT